MKIINYAKERRREYRASEMEKRQTSRRKKRRNDEDSCVVPLFERPFGEPSAQIKEKRKIKESPLISASARVDSFLSAAARFLYHKKGVGGSCRIVLAVVEQMRARLRK